MRDTGAAKRFAVEQRRYEAKAMRFYGALFEHWGDCPTSRCRRAKGCRGEAAACFRRWWRALTEQEREAGRARLRDVIAARVGI